MDDKTQTNIDLDTLTCPITLQVFRDPVVAKDGHVYERSAIVRWIEIHGTSPLTREPLTVEDLQSDEYLKYLASRRRSSGLSIITQIDATVLPRDNTDNKCARIQMIYQRTLHLLKRNQPYIRAICLGLLMTLFTTAVILGLILGLRRKNNSDDSIQSTTTTSILQSSFSWQLTTNSPTYQCIDCESTNHYYGAFTLDASSNGYYTVAIQSNMNIFPYIYMNNFSPNNPRLNQVSFIDKSDDASRPKFVIYLMADVQYILVVTSQGILMKGNFTIVISGLSHCNITPMKISMTTTTVANVKSTTTTKKVVSADSQWSQYGVTIAGNGIASNGVDQLFWPDGIFMDNDDQSILVADYWNSRIVHWNIGERTGTVVASGYYAQNPFFQLNGPIDVLIDKSSNSFIICDWKSQRVIRWSRTNANRSEILLGNIRCSGLAIDSQRNIYVSSFDNDEVRRYQIGNNSGILVAGGNGKGNNLNQLNNPSYLFVDEKQNIYVSDKGNNRVMKWNKGATKGIIIIDGHNMDLSRNALLIPRGLFVDGFGNVYVVDAANNRVIRWVNGTNEITVIVGRNGSGNRADQLNSPRGLSFDLQGNLYVVDSLNNRVQQFSMM